SPEGKWIVAGLGILFLLFLIARRRRLAVQTRVDSIDEEDIVVTWPKGAAGQLTIEPWMTAPEVGAVFAALTKEGKEARFVGGCVRNALMHLPIVDIDIATQEPPERVVALLQEAGIQAVPTGIEHGTVTAVANGKTFEITTLRRDVSTDGRRATVAFTEDWREDAARRDFTFNSLSATLDGAVYDYFNGMQDLAHRVIRFVGRVNERIAEDRLRILRYFRFIAVYGMRIGERYEFQMVVNNAEHLAELSAERIRDELIKILGSANHHDAVRMMFEQGIFAVILPEVTGTVWFKRLSWLDSSAIKIDAIGPDPIRRLAALIETDRAGAEAVARRLKLSRAQIRRLSRLKEPAWPAHPEIDEAHLRGVLSTLGAEEVIDLALLEWSRRLIITPRLPKAETEAWQKLLAQATAWEPVDLPIKGGDIVALGIPTGPRVSELLREVEGWWRDGGCRADREACLTELKSRIINNTSNN
ncbi:MAG: putative tRNA adenylyltransferase, partial [Rhodospirillales bacterium]|nr:putative tRNA adenylyltransferase [Rhodospirillales bacterium]